MYVCVQSLSRVQLSVTLWTVATKLLCPWDSSGKNVGVGCHFLLQGIIPTQRLNPGLLYFRQILSKEKGKSFDLKDKEGGSWRLGSPGPLGKGNSGETD